MDRKWWIILGIVVAVVLLGALIVYAVTLKVTINFPKNNSEYFSTTMANVSAWITTNVTADNCTVYVSTSTTPGASGTDMTYIDVSSNKTWNTTFSTAATPNGRAARTIWYSCYNDSVIYTSNTSATAGLLYFYINERTTDSIGISMVTPSTNLTATDSGLLNITTNVTATSCTYYYINSTNGTAATLTQSGSMTADASNRYFSSTLTVGDTRPNEYSNVTFMCADAYDNRSWMNTSINTSFFYYKLNLLNPTISRDNVTIVNKSIASDMGYTVPTLNLTYMVTTNFFDYCWVKVYQPTESSAITYNVSNHTFSSTSPRGWCTMYLNNSQITGNGAFAIQKWANTTTKRNSTSGTYANDTGVTYALKAGQWNLIGTYGNETLSEVCARIPNATYVSYFNNSANQKNYTTHTCGSSTSATYQVYDGPGLYIAVNGNVQAFNMNYTAFNGTSGVTIASNSSATVGSPWNLVSVYLWNGTRLSGICDLHANITYVTKHDMSSNTYYSHKCGWNINNVTAYPGEAVWVALNDAFTRTIYS